MATEKCRPCRQGDSGFSPDYRKVCMGYAVKKVISKHRTWRLMIERNTFPDGKRVRVYDAIPVDKLGLHGFNPQMTLEEAKLKASLLNRDSEVKRHAEKKVAITQRIADENRALALKVPDEEEFQVWAAEEHLVKWKGPNKHDSQWQCAKRVVKDLDLLPQDYYERRRRIYFWFADNTLSVAYLKKVLRFLNLYGRFYSRKYKIYFEPVPYPKGVDKERINDALLDSKDYASKAAKPLDPAHLEAERGSFSKEQFNWIYLSMWLGLRPLEVDSLQNDKRTEVYVDDHGTTVVKVYQSKLSGIERKLRWKLIPLVEPEQKCIPDLLKQPIDRPLAKTMAAHLGKGHNTYSGRKGFETLMKDRDQRFDHVSAWLGHQSLDQTWWAYTDRTVARYKKAS